MLIAGGKGKGQDFAPLAEAARGRVAHGVVIGEDGPKIAAALLAAGIPVSPAASMQAAIDTAQCLRRVTRRSFVRLIMPSSETVRFA